MAGLSWFLLCNWQKKRNTLSTTTVQLKYFGGGGGCVLVMQQSRDQILCILCWYKKFKIHTGTWLCSCLPFYAFGELKNYSSTHFLLLVGSGGSRAARIASSKTFLSPFCKKTLKHKILVLLIYRRMGWCGLKIQQNMKFKEVGLHKYFF